MINLLKKTALEAGELLIKYLHQDFNIQYKTSQHDLVTEADIAVQNFIQKKLETGMIDVGFKKNELGFIGEEGLNRPAKYTFVIDPIDGTNNFASGYNLFASAIGLFKDDELIASAISIPIEGSVYYAELGKGAYKEVGGVKTELRIKLQPLADCLLGTYLSSDPEMRSRLFKIYTELIPQIRSVRMDGSSVYDLCKLMDNVFHLILYPRTYIWDMAAATLMIREAGGDVYDWFGQVHRYDLKDIKKRYSILGCHPDNAGKVVDCLKANCLQNDKI